MTPDEIAEMVTDTQSWNPPTSVLAHHVRALAAELAKALHRIEAYERGMTKDVYDIVHAREAAAIAAAEGDE